jgi:hypothetical protein
MPVRTRAIYRAGLTRTSANQLRPYYNQKDCSASLALVDRPPQTVAGFLKMPWVYDLDAQQDIVGQPRLLGAYILISNVYYWYTNIHNYASGRYMVSCQHITGPFFWLRDRPIQPSHLVSHIFSYKMVFFRAKFQ